MLVVAIAAWGNTPATLFGGGLAGRFGGFRILLIGTLGLAVGTAGTALLGFPCCGRPWLGSSARSIPA